MADIGYFHTLTVIDQLPQGLYLDDLNGGRLLLPKRQVPEGTAIGDSLRVFVYLDSDDRPIATMQRPRAQLHQAAHLTVSDVNRMGAFMDWGLAKDLFVPFAEQNQRMEEGNNYVVYVTLDNTGRLIASAKLNRFIKDEAKANWPGAPQPFEQGDKVQLLIAQRTDIGYKAIINNEFWGLLHESQIHKALRVGQKMDGYIRRIRDDFRVDLSLEPLGHSRIDPLAKKILDKLASAGGQLGIGDHSPADLIELQFGVSKRAFKMAIGKLYKERQVMLMDNGIRLATDEDKAAAKKISKKSPTHKQHKESSKPTVKKEISEKEESNRAKPASQRTVYRNPKNKTANTLKLKK